MLRETVTPLNASTPDTPATTVDNTDLVASSVPPSPTSSPIYSLSFAKFLQRVERRSSSVSGSRVKKAPPAPESTPVAKRTRSLKRTALLVDLESSQDSVQPNFSEKSPDKTLIALKAKQKKKKQNSLQK